MAFFSPHNIYVLTFILIQQMMLCLVVTFFELQFECLLSNMLIQCERKMEMSTTTVRKCLLFFSLALSPFTQNRVLKNTSTL